MPKLFLFYTGSSGMGSLIQQANSENLSVNEIIERSGVCYQHILVVLLCMLVNMIDGFDITAMAVVASDISLEMNLSEDKLGFVFGFSLAGIMVGAMFLASFSDVVGRRPMIIISLFVVALSVLLTALARDFYIIILLRFISGLGAGVMLASQATLTSEYSPERYRSLSVAIVTAGYPLGAMMTGLVSGFIVDDYGWRSMFLFGGGVSIFLCVIAFKFLPESMQFLCVKKPHNSLKKVNFLLANYKLAPVSQLPKITHVDNNAVSVVRKSIIGNMRSLLSEELKSRTLIIWVVFSMANVTMYFLMSWLPKLMVNAGYTKEIAGYAFSAYNLGGVAGIFVMGILATVYRLSLVVSVFLVMSGAFMLLFAFSSASISVLLGIIGMVGVFLQGGFVGMYALAAKLYPSEFRATGVGWTLGVGRFGAIAGPTIAGFTIASGMTINLNFVLFSLPVLVVGLLVYRLNIR